MHRLKRTGLAMTLLIGSVIISGCNQISQPRSKPKPVRPTLEKVVEQNDMVCFGKQDATKLGLYILELERI